MKPLLKFCPLAFMSDMSAADAGVVDSVDSAVTDGALATLRVQNL